MTTDDTALDWMQHELTRRRFTTWTLTIQPATDTHTALLTIRYTAPDARTGEHSRFRADRRIGPYPTPDVGRFHADVTAALRDAWMHEFDEANQLDGTPINDPHADPSRWQCAPCRVVGPPRREGASWTCPDCRSNHGPTPAKAETGDSEP